MVFFSISLACDSDTDTATWLPGSVAVPPATISSESCVPVLTPHRGPLVRLWRSFELAWREISTRSRLPLDKERPCLLLLEPAAVGSENLDVPFSLGSFFCGTSLPVFRPLSAWPRPVDCFSRFVLALPFVTSCRWQVQVIPPVLGTVPKTEVMARTCQREDVKRKGEGKVEKNRRRGEARWNSADDKGRRVPLEDEPLAKDHTVSRLLTDLTTATFLLKEGRWRSLVKQKTASKREITCRTAPKGTRHRRTSGRRGGVKTDCHKTQRRPWWVGLQRNQVAR